MLGRRIFAPESFALHNIPATRNMINSPTYSHMLMFSSPTYSHMLRFGQKRSRIKRQIAHRANNNRRGCLRSQTVKDRFFNCVGTRSRSRG
jgi:hypothetical protein